MPLSHSVIKYQQGNCQIFMQFCIGVLYLLKGLLKVCLLLCSAWPICMRFNTEDIHMMVFCNYKLFIYVNSESHTDITDIHKILSVFPTNFIWFGYKSVHAIFMQCCPTTVSFMKVSAVKAILYVTMYMRFVQILYIFHPLCIKFSTGDVHKNLLWDHEFGKNQYSKIHDLFSIYEFCETLCR